MEQSIVVGMTDSDEGRRALAWASERAVTRGSRIELLTVVGGALGAVGEGRILAEITRSAMALLEGDAEVLRERGVHVDTRVEQGSPVDELVAASAVSDLLVIGSGRDHTHGGSLRGSRGIRIVAGAHCPVAVVPILDGRIRRGVVVGFDGSDEADRALSFAFAEAERIEETLTVVHTWQPIPLPPTMSAYPNGYFAGLQKMVAAEVESVLAAHVQEHPGVEIRRVVERGFPAHSISEAARDARMAVVGSHGRGAIARFFLGSTSQFLLDDPPAVTVVVK